MSVCGQKQTVTSSGRYASDAAGPIHVDRDAENEETEGPKKQRKGNRIRGEGTG